MTRPTRTFSARFDTKVLDRLEARGRLTGRSKSSLAERYVDEGTRMDEHPGIVFRDGPMGRRAALAGGPDVWEVVSVVQNAPEREERAVEHATDWLSLTAGEVITAVAYYGDFPDEVDERIERNREEADAAEAAWRRRRAALA